MGASPQPDVARPSDTTRKEVARCRSAVCIARTAISAAGLGTRAERCPIEAAMDRTELAATDEGSKNRSRAGTHCADGAVGLGLHVEAHGDIDPLGETHAPRGVPVG